MKDKSAKVQNQIKELEDMVAEARNSLSEFAGLVESFAKTLHSMREELDADYTPAEYKTSIAAAIRKEAGMYAAENGEPGPLASFVWGWGDVAEELYKVANKIEEGGKF